MSKTEQKARAIVRESYFDYLSAILRSEVKQYKDDCSMTYSAQMDLLYRLFPKTTNVEALEGKWYAMWQKENA